ncbi:hypothetical protein ABS71_17880 [bacterium SCN 62-11]|nr:hypothetical protein [Candidatus Eremiobacteraeota bacterium]ODT59452.1 MAG: hypothetical protein ABS71_17880 [bacterium SCN 62-11]
MAIQPISASVSTPVRTAAPVARPEPAAAPAPQPEVKTGVEALSLENKVELSQKAVVAPPPPPSQGTKKKSAPEKAPVSKRVEGEDFAGRTCSGELHGPLLMEAPGGLTFELEHERDFETMAQMGLQLGQVPAELLHSPAGETPLVKEKGFSYFGMEAEGARLVQHIEGEAAEPSRVKLPSGQEVLITRGPNEISILVPAASLDELANWGRNLLAIG